MEYVVYTLLRRLNHQERGQLYDILCAEKVCPGTWNVWEVMRKIPGINYKISQGALSRLLDPDLGHMERAIGALDWYFYACQYPRLFLAMSKDIEAWK